MFRRPACIRHLPGFDDLPHGYRQLFAAAGESDFFLGLSWFRALTDTTRDAGDELIIYGIDEGDPDRSATAALVMRATTRVEHGVRLRVLSGFTNVYSMVYAPVVRPGAPRLGEALAAWADAIAAHRPPWDAVRMGALDADSPALPSLAAALHSAGFVVSPHGHFGNWYEPVNGRTYEGYLASLPGKMRYNLRAHARKLEKCHQVRFALYSAAVDTEHALADYERLYQRSWKEPEAYPDFIAALVRAAGASGALRLGILYVDGLPAAGQIWIVNNGRATIYKMAYDEAFRKQGVGSILTARMMEAVLARDPVCEMDFGFGDDPYKKDWLRRRRERIELEAYNPRTARGLLSAAILVGGRAVKHRLKRALARH